MRGAGKRSLRTAASRDQFHKNAPVRFRTGASGESERDRMKVLAVYPVMANDSPGGRLVNYRT
ncbi:MAG: hypothetical protein ACK58L_21515, partial [Planctomycetota bacterium]